MPLAQLIYVSRRTPELTPERLTDIVAGSAERNARLSITGALLCCGEHVMQLLEGDRDAIEALFERISQDPRHTDVQRLVVKNVRKRLCPAWGMRLADLANTGPLDRKRLTRLIEDIGVSHDTSHLAVEARVLLDDFRRQLGRAA